MLWLSEMLVGGVDAEGCSELLSMGLAGLTTMLDDIEDSEEAARVIDTLRGAIGLSAAQMVVAEVLS